MKKILFVCLGNICRLTGESVTFGFEKVYTMIETYVEDILRKIENGSL